MIIFIILILLIGIGWPIFMIWYGSSECMENDYQKYIKRKIKNETNKKYKK
jgi:hypothetical protein